MLMRIAIQLEIRFVFTTAGDDTIRVLQHALEAQLAFTNLSFWASVCDLICDRQLAAGDSITDRREQPLHVGVLGKVHPRVDARNILSRPCMSVSQYPAGLDEATRQLLTDGAKLSQMAYSSPEAVTPDKFEVLKRVEGTPEFFTCTECDANCYIAKYKPPRVSCMPASVLAICARGTSSVLDWVCDAEVDQVLFKDANGAALGRVHAGFHRQFLGLFRLFGDQVRKHLAGGGVLLCFGHSLGSSIGAVAALYYGRDHPGQVFYAGYGTPRVFDPDAAKAFNGCVKGKWRVKHRFDPVDACIPPIDYKHVGSEVHMGAIDRHPDVPLLIDVGDHDISKYIAALQNGGDDKVERKNTATKSWLQSLLKI